MIYHLEAEFMYQTLTYKKPGRSTMPNITVVQAQTEDTVIERTVQYALMVLSSDDSTLKLPT